MATHNDLGKTGENLAKEFLVNKGFKILKENWRFKHKEIDLVCKDGDDLIFVEVKTRSDDFFQQPYEAVEYNKINFMVEAAEAFIEKYEDFAEIRYDIVSIVLKKGAKPSVEHIVDAFIPGVDK